MLLFDYHIQAPTIMLDTYFLIVQHYLPDIASVKTRPLHDSEENGNNSASKATQNETEKAVPEKPTAVTGTNAVYIVSSMQLSGSRRLSKTVSNTQFSTYCEIVTHRRRMK